MARTKNEVLIIRTTAEVKALLRLAAVREHRSVASMAEVLIRDNYGRNGTGIDWQKASPGAREK